MRTRLVATTLALTVAGGGLTGLVLSQTASAQTGSTTTTAPADGATPAVPAPPTDRAQRRTDKLSEALQGLVDAGTITAAQRDAVVEAIAAAEPAGGGRHGGGPGGMGDRGGFGRGGFGRSASLEAAATALGLDVAGLREALAGGTTMAALAEEKGVAVDTVVAAIVAAETARIDQAVTDGKLTAEQAETAKAALTERATALVDGTLPAKGPRGDRGGRGPRGGAPAETPEAAPSAASGAASATNDI